MIDDSHLFDDFKPVAGEREADVLLRIEKKLDKLIDLMSMMNRPTPPNICSRYNYKGMENGEYIFEDEYGHRTTEAELREYQETLKDFWNAAVEDVYDKERFWNEPKKRNKD